MIRAFLYKDAEGNELGRISFSPGTLVRLSTGETKPIADVAVGDCICAGPICKMVDEIIEIEE